MFLLDVHIPESIAHILEEPGYEARRGHELFAPGTTDKEIAGHAAASGLIVVSCDKGFGDITRFPPDRYPGMIVLRPRTHSLRALTSLFREFLGSIDLETCRRRITIVEPGRVRQFPARTSEG